MVNKVFCESFWSIFTLSIKKRSDDDDDDDDDRVTFKPYYPVDKIYCMHEIIFGLKSESVGCVKLSAPDTKYFHYHSLKVINNNKST